MKILIVDDEMLAREVLKTQLEVLNYQDIQMAADGESALLALNNEVPDVIFLDICMPEMSGIEFMEHATQYKKDIVCIILSGYDVFEYAQQAMELGAHQYLLKPVATQTLMKTMNKAELMISKQSNGDEFQGHGRTAHEKIMWRAKAYIKQNIGYDLTLESVAEHVNFSPTYFSRFFKSEEGMNFIDYVTKTRIEKAKELLDRNVKTADICSEIGFRDVKHFYKIFKKIEGVTPGQYKSGLIIK